jgi:hypothetical protein
MRQQRDLPLLRRSKGYRGGPYRWGAVRLMVRGRPWQRLTPRASTGRCLRQMVDMAVD